MCRLVHFCQDSTTRNTRLSLVTFALLTVSTCFPATAAPGFDVVLPPPPGVNGFSFDASGTLRQAILIDGLPVAFRYDDFWSYSAQLLDQLQDEGFIPTSYGDYLASTGTGNLDVILFTGAGGADNQGVGLSGTFDFEDPVAAPTGGTSTLDGFWGQNDQDDDNIVDFPSVNGPVTVGEVLAYLQEFNPDNSIPTFIFDNNQTGNTPSTLGSGQIRIIDPSDGSTVAFWSFDTDDEGTILDNIRDFDIDDKVLAQGEVTLTGTSGTEYNLNHNLGSGLPDFLIFSPTMDLSLYDDDFWFVGDFHLMGLNNGFEELFMTGRIGQNLVGNPVPEPASTALFGVGVVALIGFHRRNRKRAV